MPAIWPRRQVRNPVSWRRPCPCLPSRVNRHCMMDTSHPARGTGAIVEAPAFVDDRWLCSAPNEGSGRTGCGASGSNARGDLGVRTRRLGSPGLRCLVEGEGLVIDHDRMLAVNLQQTLPDGAP